MLPLKLWPIIRLVVLGAWNILKYWWVSGRHTHVHRHVTNKLVQGCFYPKYPKNRHKHTHARTRFSFRQKIHKEVWNKVISLVNCLTAIFTIFPLTMGYTGSKKLTVRWQIVPGRMKQQQILSWRNSSWLLFWKLSNCLLLLLTRL